jgi:hypothetical protein
MMRAAALLALALALTGCVGDNLADIAQAQAAAEAARAAQESARAAQVAAGGLATAVIAPWIIASILAVTVAAWVWAVYILPAMRGVPAPPKTVVIRQRGAPAMPEAEPLPQLPAGQAGSSLEDVIKLSILASIAQNQRNRDGG